MLTNKCLVHYDEKMASCEFLFTIDENVVY